VEGPAAALRLVDALALDCYYLGHAIRADPLDVWDTPPMPLRACAAAMAAADNATERALLQQRYEASGGT
jgi:RNA polymerase sigma-70 factor, ECF subfamily